MDEALSIYMVPNVAVYFVELAQIIQHVLLKRGQRCCISDHIDPKFRTIILGLNVVPGLALPNNAIIVNMEQLYDDSKWLTPVYISQLKRHTVWDYCKHNVEYLRLKLGVEAQLLEYGPIVPLAPLPCREAFDQHKTTEVVLIGEKGHRRDIIATELKNKGVKVEYHSRIWGKARDDVLNHSKILINVHFFPCNLLELPRLCWGLEHNAFILSETCANVDDFPWIKECVAFASYEKLVEQVLYYLANPEKRYEQHVKAHDIYRGKTPHVPNV